jgi:hypothetical protein
VAQRAQAFARQPASRRPVLVNGAAGVVVIVGDIPFSVMGFTVVAGKIIEINTIADPERLQRLTLAIQSYFSSGREPPADPLVTFRSPRVS